MAYSLGVGLVLAAAATIPSSRSMNSADLLPSQVLSTALQTLLSLGRSLKSSKLAPGPNGEVPTTRKLAREKYAFFKQGHRTALLYKLGEALAGAAAIGLYRWHFMKG